MAIPRVTPTDFVFPSDGYRWALYAMVIFSVSRIHQHVGPLSALRPGLVTAMLALGFALMNPAVLSYASIRTRPARYMIALVIMACVSVPFGISIGGSGKFLLDTYFRVVLAYVLVALALRTPRHLSQFTWAWVLSCGILALLAIFVFDLRTVGGTARLGGLYMYDANDLGLILVMGVPLALVTIETSGALGRLVGSVILLSCGVALARSGSRGAFVGLVLLVPAFLIWAKHIAVQKRFLAVAVLAGGLIFAAPFGYWEQMRSLTDPTEDYNWDAEQGRRKVALRGLSYMADHPLTGLGVDNFRKAEWTISEMAQDEFRERGIKGSAAHNTWLQAGAEMGVPGLILWVVLVFGTMMAVVRERIRLPRTWHSGDRDQRILYSLATNLPLSILAFAVISTFVSFAYVDPMYYLAAMSSGLIVSIRRKQAQVAAVLGTARPE
jgi:O-antigen ligase